MNTEPNQTGGCLTHLAATLERQWQRFRKKLKRCQEEFSEAAVHDTRVETRRLLSLTKLLGPFLPAGRLRKVERALKHHLDTFDDLRDAHVQLLAVEKFRRTFPGARSFYNHLLKREDRLARKARKDIKGIRTRRLGKLIAACGEEIARQGKQPAARKANGRLLGAVDGAFARVRDLRARIDPEDVATIHRTRVAFKKFRYMIEILADHLAGTDGKLLATLHRYQTRMGVIQDVEVLAGSFDKYAEKKKLDAEDVGRFRAELLRRRQRLVGAYLKAADQVFEFWPLPGSGGRPSDGSRASQSGRKGKE